MHTAQNAARLPFGALTVHRVVSFVSDLAERLQGWNDRRRTLSELRRLDADQLEDIGLTREALERFAREGRF